MNVPRLSHLGISGVALVSMFVVTGSVPAPCQTETTLYGFTDPNGYPEAGVNVDAAGNLYGTTNGSENYSGIAFQLQPPSEQGGAWTENVLFYFDASKPVGGNPEAGLILDKQGNLYGTTVQGPGVGQSQGSAFELSPPAVKGGAWTETTLYVFGSDGNYYDASGSTGNLVMDAKGYLYGTSLGGGSERTGFTGTIFELMPPAQGGGAWTEQVIFAFPGFTRGGDAPYGPVVFDKKGNLYGTTSLGGIVKGGDGGFGIVYELTPPRQQGAAWTETVLYEFTGGKDGDSPQAGMIFDQAGNLYGTTSRGGSGGANCDTETCGVVFELSPSGGAWTEKVLHNFTGKGDGGYPVFGSLAIDSAGDLYGTTFEGGEPADCPNQYSGCGVAFRLKPPSVQGGDWTEQVLHTFTNGADGALPAATPLIYKDSLYGTAEISDNYQGFGTVFEIAK